MSFDKLDIYSAGMKLLRRAQADEVLDCLMVVNLLIETGAKSMHCCDAIVDFAVPQQHLCNATGAWID